MWVRHITISGVGGIASLAITFDPSMNIICGPNGIGKTTILECVAHIFSAGQTNILKRNARTDISTIEATVNTGIQDVIAKLSLKEFLPNREDHLNGLLGDSNKLISLKINRTFDYKALDSVGRDPGREPHIIYSEARSGIKLTDVKSWFVNRYLYSPHGTLSNAQQVNFNLAKSSFSALDGAFAFSRVDPSTNEILVTSPTGEIYYEYLSSGFKSCLSIIFGIIKEIEFRFPSPGLEAALFDGVIIIDEIELHLHPEWQSLILVVLMRLFPKVQFICSTHSPHVIQGASANQIIAIEYNEGAAVQRTLPESEFGFKGWSVEEILTDVMGMRELTTTEYREALRSFEKAVDSDNMNAAESSFRTLDKMLHPQSHLRKLFRLQLATIAELAE